MTTIELYQPRAINIKVDIPTSWDELTGSELVLIAGKLIGIYANSHESKVHILVGLINSRLQTQKKRITKQWFNNINRDDAAIAVTDAVAWVISGNSLTVMLLPVIKIGWLKRAYFGPKGNFENLTCGEFEDAEIFFFKFRQQKQLEDLVMLTAILWRTASPRPVSGRKGERLQYIGYDAALHTKRLGKVDGAVLYANYLWYTGCRNQLSKFFPLFFGGSGTGEPDLIAFTKCIHAGAGPENGTRENIRRTPLKEFAMDMEMRIQRNNELKEELEKQKNRR